MSSEAPGASTPKHGNGYLVWVVFILTLASTFSIIDRQILNVMIGPIKRDLDISDSQMGLLMGAAFAVLYNLLSYPAGWMADRYNRRNLMAGGIAAWSLMTVVCGTAHSYVTLFAARMGVGVGEAALAPAAYSTMADYFKAARLPLAIGVVGAAPFLGQGLAGLVGGPLIDYLEARPQMSVPVLGEIYSWQAVFWLVGLPGLVVALLFFTIREPRRHGKTEADGKGVPFSVVWSFVKSRRAFFVLIFTGYLALSTQGWSLMLWIYEYFVREHGLTRTQVGVPYGIISIVAGISGSVFAGGFAGYWISKGRKDGTLRLVFIGTCLLGPSAVVLTLLPSAYAAIALLIPVTFLMAMPPGLISSALQQIAPNELRGQMIAFYMIAVNFLSYLVAPQLPPALDLLIYGREDTLGVSISVLAAINYSIAAICIGFGLRYFRKALKDAEAWQDKLL
ncbi:MFS transporter [Emcibacter sp. SYSU 3D8]|uniref:MFS transporter n=1 Tax=Emcibacter sp. SYSU 3D8 TaxID=3133969 RepID=UPI0031FEEB9F